MTRPAVEGRRRVDLGGTLHEYDLRRSARKTLAITIEPAGELVVTAPSNASVERIEAVLRRRRQWIRRQTRFLASLPAPVTPREWVSGETHRYLGRQYRLRVVQAREPGVRLSGRFFYVKVKDRSDRQTVRQLMEAWYRDRARATFARRMAMIVEATPRLRLSEPPPMVVRKFAQRWGSCSPDGRILLNVDAVRLPAGCIDYLIMHELCHLHVPHHGPKFWRLLGACMPDWETWRERLARAEI